MKLKYQPTSPLDNLIKRAEVIHYIRSFFDKQGFLEVQTPILSHDTIIDHYVEPIAVTIDQRAQHETFYLQTSPEFGMKRLLASGMKQIYQITPVFRRGDRGKHHNIEFTMLEWYRVGDNYQEGRDFLAHLICAITGADHCDQISFGKFFEMETGLNPYRCTPDQYLSFANNHGISWPDSFLDQKNPATNDDWIDLLFSERVQPKLGRNAPTILYDYPGTQSQLATSRKEVLADGTTVEIAERFELFINGLELANGYHELCDPNVLRERNAKTIEARQRSGKPALPIESRLLAAMDAGFPPCSGCALGIDRLLMVLLQAESIDEVIPFPVEIA